MVLILVASHGLNLEFANAPLTGARGLFEGIAIYFVPGLVGVWIAVEIVRQVEVRALKTRARREFASRTIIALIVFCTVFILCTGVQFNIFSRADAWWSAFLAVSLEAVRQLNLAGVDAGVICGPVLPEITDAPHDLEAVVEAASRAGAKYIFANPLFLKPCSAAVFLPFLEQHFPALVDCYRKRYAARAFLSKDYAQRLSRLMAALRHKHGIGREHGRKSRAAYAPQGDLQLGLFGPGH